MKSDRQSTLERARRERLRTRAREFVGCEIGMKTQRMLICRMREGRVKFARKLTHSRTVVVSDYGETEVTFIYNSRSKRILTFLSPDAEETAAWRALQRTRRPPERDGLSRP